jgi:ribosomal protein S18 acetylase RimI-like enzyme
VANIQYFYLIYNFMKTFTQKINEQVDVKVQPINTELIYLTEGGIQVGSLLLVFNEGNASIYSLEVLDSHRGKGYGKRLVEGAISLCKEKKCASLELRTEQDNKVANSLYQSMGFQLRGLKDNFNDYIKSF